MSSTVAAPQIVVSDQDRKRALWGSAVGSTIEWYDYFLYGTMSGLVFGPLFFPSNDPTVSQLLALASFALAFLIRPIGGILFSHVGDRIGRKKTLVVTLTLMGVSTVAMGLMPTYSAIGVAAPIILTVLRLLQGLALGGEWGGGLLLAVEYSPKNRRGFFGAVPQTGAMLGLALGNMITLAAGAVFSDEAFLAYGWRIPFLLSVVLLAVGLWIRHKVDETPSFRMVKAAGATKQVPLVDTLKHHWREVLIATGAKIVETSTFFMFATFTVSYAMTLGYKREAVLSVLLVCAVIGVFSMGKFGALSDRIGRKKVFLWGTVALMVFILPYLWMLNQKSLPFLAVALFIGFAVIWPTYGSLIGTVIAESFSPDIRYTGASLGYQLGAAIAGGPAPLIATALLAAFGGSYLPVGLFIILCGAISLVAVLFAKEKSNQEID
ncbi:MFS transporter [Arthrobacter sp. NPDC056727]|uniref:MFS transporter n=1 Tax=Arthrobacter sp. NPDC056727 TaxID=3345927 RepID=UPI00366F97D7